MSRRMLAVCLCLAGGAVWAQTPVEKCAGLAGFALDSAKVTLAIVVPAGGPLTGARVGPRAVAKLPAFCRVRVTDRPSADSEIRTEVWLPLEGWNGRFRGTGNGGFAGVIYFDEMAEAVTEGYAAGGTDTGHVGGEAGFALGHPEKVVDFGWRGVHDMTLQAKALATAFYGKAPTKAYFAACSDGGREALMEAERFPADYDGILAGAPAYHWTSLVSGGAMAMKPMLATPESYIPATKIPAIAATVRAQCDLLDGVKDGVLNDPRVCRFDPAPLACKAGDAADCLTVPQMASLKAIYAKKTDAKGNEVMPPTLPGAEDGGGGWANWITGDAPGKALGAFFPVGYFGNFIHDDPSWKLADFDLEKDLKLAQQKTGAALDATETNLQPFTARGGKLILYHGWNDPAIASLGTVEYFDGVRAKLGEKATADAVRLYMVPGMQHCSGGPGATTFGQSADGMRGDAGHDILTALEQWVETGKAPGTIVARKLGAAGKVEFTRPLCVWPEVAKYKGGDTADAASFTCGK